MTNVEAAALAAYPIEHVGYSQPVPEGCTCDECQQNEQKRIAFEEGAKFGLTENLGSTMGDAVETAKKFMSYFEPTEAQVKAAADTLKELGCGGYLATDDQHREVARAALLAAKEALE